MFEISVTSAFVAAHGLCGPGGTREPLHKHKWRVSVTCAGPSLGEHGLLVDFAAVRGPLAELLATFDQRSLNELPAFAGAEPSAEQVARVVAEALGPHLPESVRLLCVEIEEEPGCVARYRPGAAG